MTRRRRLPTLGTLRAFEAAARHGSFKAAAGELGVTPTSISHQVRSLEEQLGTALFERFNRRVVLTRPGTILAEALTRALDDVDAAVNQVRGEGAEDRLVVAGNPGLLDCWLRARLSRFRAAHPALALELIPSDATAAMLAGRADIALHFGAPPPSPLQGRLMHRTVDFPVAAPALGAGLRTPADLAACTFLHEQSPDWWGEWLSAAAAEIGSAWRRGPVFHSSALAIESAVAGDGVAMADELLAGDHLLAGRLVKPFGLSIDQGSGLYLAWSAGRALRPAEEHFADWLAAELARFAGEARRLVGQEPFSAPG